MAEGRDPYEAFPEEVIEAHDRYGIPWPTWYSGPLMPRLEDTPRALEAFRQFLAEREVPDV